MTNKDLQRRLQSASISCTPEDAAGLVRSLLRVYGSDAAFKGVVKETCYQGETGTRTSKSYTSIGPAKSFVTYNHNKRHWDHGDRKWVNPTGDPGEVVTYALLEIKREPWPVKRLC